MKAFRIILVIALLLTVAIPASAEIMCFYKGNDYLEFSENTKLAYIAGLSDMTQTLIEHYNPEIYKKYYEALKDMLLGQHVKILEKYLAENPEKLHRSMAVLYFYAINEIVYDE